MGRENKAVYRGKINYMLVKKKERTAIPTESGY